MKFEELHRAKNSEESAKEKVVEMQQASTFETQWENPSMMAVEGETKLIYDIRPEEAKTDIPVFIMDGWGSTPHVWKDNMHALVEMGRRTIAVHAPHGIEHKTEPPEELANTPEAELRRVAGFMNAIQSSGVEKTDVIAHSEGGIDALLAARMYPEQFRNLVLVNPGGMIGPDSFFNLAARFSYDGIKSQVHALREGTFKKIQLIGNELVKSAAKNPILATKEVQAIARTEVVQLLREVKESGVGIVIIHGADDSVFPMMRMQENISAQKQSGEDITKLLDGFYSVAGAHGEFLLRAADYTRLAENALTALEDNQRTTDSTALPNT